MNDYLFMIEYMSITGVCFNCSSLPLCAELPVFCSQYDNMWNACITALEMGY